MASKYDAIAFIGGNPITDEYYIPRFQASGMNFGQHVLKALEKSKVTESSIDEYVTEILTHESCIIYSTLNDENLLDHLLTKIGGEDHTKYTVIFLLGGLYEVDILKKQSQIQNYYIEKIYKDDPSNTFLNLYKSYTSNSLSNPTISEELLMYNYKSYIYIYIYI